MSFEITILGSGAALPTAKRNPSAQYINCNERHILIDCGEGTQNQIRRNGIKIQKIRYIFISHLHGDHYFGLLGLLSTMNLLGRTQGIKLFAPKALKEIIEIQLKASGHHYEFKLDFVALEDDYLSKIFEDKVLEIYSFPLKHRIETYGFLIKEKHKEYSILGEEFKDSGLSLEAIPFFRKGENFIDENGKLFKANKFTIPPKKSKSYAYCSDTAYCEKNIPYLKEVDLLYHEATFTETHKDKAKATLHSTAKQAADFAKKAEVNRLILGHLSSRYEDAKQHLKEATEIFENTLVVEDGMKFML